MGAFDSFSLTTPVKYTLGNFDLQVEISLGAEIEGTDVPPRKKLNQMWKRRPNTGQIWVDNCLFFVKIIMRTFLGVK